MARYVDLDKIIAEIERRIKYDEMVMNHDAQITELLSRELNTLYELSSFIKSLEVKEVDVWKTVDNINLPQADKNKIYCAFTKDRYILATVINHPKDEELLQWKCTEFPHHQYDMCEGDKYMQIV